MLRKLSKLSLAIGALTLLSACAVSPPPEKHYNAKESMALNVAKAGGLKDISDTKAPSGLSASGGIRDSAVLGVAGTVSNFAMPVSGLSNMQSGSLFLLDMFTAPAAMSSTNRVIMWLPTSDAHTRKEAAEKGMKLLSEAVMQAITEVGGKYEISADGPVGDARGFRLYLTKDGWNCRPADKSYAIEKDSCHLYLGLNMWPETITAPAFVNKQESQLSWQSKLPREGDAMSTILLSTPDNSNVPEVEIFSRASELLPDWVYLYVAPGSKTADGSVLKFPFLLHKGDALLFLKPE